jgi:hypothetical protein
MLRQQSGGRLIPDFSFNLRRFYRSDLQKVGWEAEACTGLISLGTGTGGGHFQMR